MEEKESARKRDKMNQGLFDYICEDNNNYLKAIYEEDNKILPFTKCASEFFDKLENDYNISFDEHLISDRLHDEIVKEISKAMLQ